MASTHHKYLAFALFQPWTFFQGCLPGCPVVFPLERSGVGIFVVSRTYGAFTLVRGHSLLMLKTFVRGLSMRTTLSPASVAFHYPDAPHAGLVVLTTPSQLTRVVAKAIDDFQDPRLRPIPHVLVACVDSMLGSRDGYSELYLDAPLQMRSMAEIKHQPKERDPLSVDPVRMDKNWAHRVSKLTLNINDSHTIGLPLANTLFANGEHSTCFYVGGSEMDWINLSEATADIQVSGLEGHINYTNRLREIPLVQGVTDSYKVTSYEGNLIKSINGNSPSQYLIDNPEVMGTKRDLYFELYHQGITPPAWDKEYYKLIVGGLGWGEKQAFLGVDPIVGDVGYRNVRLYEFDRRIPSPPPKGSRGIVLECPQSEEGYRAHEAVEEPENSVVVLDAFAMGADRGFELDGRAHGAQGERLALS